MTLPDERYRAVIRAEVFLRRLSNPALTKRVPKEIREEARNILRHYPNTWDMEKVCTDSPDIFQVQMEDVTRMFKRYEQSKAEKNEN